MPWHLVTRALFVAAVAWAAALTRAFHPGLPINLGVGIALGILIVYIETRLRSTGRQKRYRILDTSVIIDGRIADVCETGFLDGTLVIPQFVLKELQLVADSADSLKRNRGRRGLDILQKIQKMAGVDVTLSDIDFPEIREVDLKLIELGRTLQGKIVPTASTLH